MATPKRFEKGVTNVGTGGPLANLPTMSPIKCHIFFDDFNYYDDAAAGGSGGHWATTSTSSGNSVLEIDGDGGLIQIHVSVTDDDVMRVQGVKEGFTLEAGKKAWFGTRFSSINNSTQSDFILALAVTDASPIASSPADWVGFRKSDGADTLDFHITASGVGVGVDADIGGYTAAGDVYQDLEWEFDGVDTFTYYVDGVIRGSLTTASFPTTEMTPTMALQAGTGASCDINIDYIYMIKER